MYSKKETYAITRKLYAFLKENDNHVILHKLRGYCGTYDSDTKTVQLDPRRDIVPTLIHELLHHWHPDWCETKVLAEESKVVNSLSIKQLGNILKAIGEAL